MMKGRVWSTLAVMMAVALAGCAEDAGQLADDAGVYDSLELEAAQDKGIIKGVVIDEAIRPLPGATIQLAGPEGETSTTSNEQGAFGFDGLAPGDYFLTIAKNGYNTVQQSTAVQAGVEPESIKAMLTADPSAMAFVDTLMERGYVECSTTVFAVCGFGDAVTNLAGVDQFQEQSQFRYPLLKVPDHVQTEMVWQNSQALNGEFSLLYSFGDCSGFYCDDDTTGPSPLLNDMTGDAVDTQTQVDGEQMIYIRVFSAGLAETSNLVGLSFQQDFEMFTHAFYNFGPPDGWRFTDANEVPDVPE